MRTARIWWVGAVAAPLLASCGVTSRMEPYKQTNTVISEGEHVVILARKQHATHEAEQDFVECISDALAKGESGLDVHSSKEFEDKMYPWFEPSTAPLSTDDLSQLLERPGVMNQVQRHRCSLCGLARWVDRSCRERRRHHVCRRRGRRGLHGPRMVGRRFAL